MMKHTKVFTEKKPFCVSYKLMLLRYLVMEFYLSVKHNHP